MPSTTPFLPFVKAFIEMDPAGAARRLEAMPVDQAIVVFTALPRRLKSMIFPRLQVGYGAALLTAAKASDFTAIVRGLDAERAAAIFMQLPEDAQERIVPHLPERVPRHTQELLRYPEDTVGRVMLPHFISFHQEMKVRDAVRTLKSMSRGQIPASYAYVVDEKNVLKGVLNMYDLVVAQSDALLSSVMRKEVFSLPAFTTVEDAANELSKRRYFAAPVVDGEKHILGIVKAEQLIHGTGEEIGEKIQQMFGAGGDEGAFSPITYSLRKRMPWLHVNLATAFLAAAVVALFEPTIAKITVLAVFLPVVAGQGGNAGAQALAVVMRGLVMREIPRQRYRKLILKEATLGLIHGAVTGVVTGVVAMLWFGNPILGLVVTMGMVVNLFAAGLSGASIPIILKAVGLDPAQCSSIILTTVTDVVGFFAFLSFAVAFQSYLV